MGNIVNDIVDEVEIKPKDNKKILKIVISVAISLVVVAFTFGQFKSSFFNRMDKFEETLTKNTTAIITLNKKQDAAFEAVDVKIDKVYDDGLVIFNDFQVYNNKQLELIIDYGSSNKDMLKRMLEINTLERTRNVESQVETVKKEQPKINYESSISVQRVDEQPASKDYYGLVFFIDVESNDTIFNVSAATQKFVDDVDRNKYKVGATTESPEYPKRYDFSYQNK